MLTWASEYSEINGGCQFLVTLFLDITGHRQNLSFCFVLFQFSFLTGTSRGYVALFSVPHNESYSFTPSVPILPTQLWQPHAKPVTHLSSAYLRSMTSAYQLDTPEPDMLILSASEDSHVAVCLPLPPSVFPAPP